MKAPDQIHFTLYPEKFLSSTDVQLMSIDEFGAYCKILFASSLQDKPGYILNDEESLIKICNLTENKEKWESIKPVVMKKFKQDGMFIYNEVLVGILKSEEKSKKKLKKADIVSLTSQLNYTFDSFWNDYDKKVGSAERLIPKWIKLSNEDREEIRVYIPKYKEAQPNKQFRMNPETFLNQRGWKFELIQSGKKLKMPDNRNNNKIIDYENEPRTKV